MNPKIKEIILLLSALGVLAVAPLFVFRGGTIETDMPELTSSMLNANAEQAQKAQQAARQQAERRKGRKMFTCEMDDECIIVDRDPCGCLVGPQGVTAINATYTFEFNKEMDSLMTQACPATPPSLDKECSLDARPVCQENFCKIVY